MSIKIAYLIASRASLNAPRGSSVHLRSFLENFIKIGGPVFLIRKGKELNEYHSIKIYNISWPSAPPKLQKLYDIFFNLRLYMAAQSIIQKEKPDLLHEREIYLNLSGWLLARKFNLPYILEVNAPLLYEARESFPFYKNIHQAIEKKIFFKADRIIAVSETMKKFLISQKVSSKKIEVIPNGVDAKLFSPHISGKPVRSKYDLKDKKVIGYAGSLHQDWQGISDLLEAAKTIFPLRPDLRFLIVGGFNSEIVKLKKFSPSNVIFTGKATHKEIPKYLAAADILVAPYRPQMRALKEAVFYGSPLKLLEYMAMGKPIIATNIGQISEILSSGKNALLIQPGNFQQLARNILKLVDNGQLSKKLGYNARLTIEKSYTWEHNARKIMKVYQEVLKEKRTKQKNNQIRNHG